MNWIFKRLREPSTGAGIALIAQMAKAVPALAPYGVLLDGVAAVAAAHAVVIPEVKAK